MASGQGVQEETLGEVEARLDSLQDCVRLRVRSDRVLHSGLARPAVAGASHHCFQWTPADAPALLHLIGSGIKLHL